MTSAGSRSFCSGTNELGRGDRNTNWPWLLCCTCTWYRLTGVLILNLLTYSFIHLLTHPFTHPLAHSLTHPSNHSFIHSSIHSSIGSLTHPLAHSLIHSLILWIDPGGRMGVTFWGDIGCKWPWGSFLEYWSCSRSWSGRWLHSCIKINWMLRFVQYNKCML